MTAAWTARHGDRYGLLLLLLVFSYVISAFTTARYVGAAVTVLFVAALLLALRTSGVNRRTRRLLIGAVAAGSVTAVVAVLSHASQVGIGLANLWTAVILLLTVVVIVRRVLTMPTVSLQSIFGAVSAYMIIGLMFAAIYGGMSRLEHGPFFAGGSPANTRTLQYFSFTTLTTLGYGDFTAASNAGRAVAVMEALGGQVFLATLVARLVTSFRGPRAPGTAAPPARAPARPPAAPRRAAPRTLSRQPRVKWRGGRR
jgi:heme A synthase